MNGLFDPYQEHDACGVGFVAYLDGQSRHEVLQMSLTAMARMAHRGGGHGKSGDGAGLLFPLPRNFFVRQWPLLASCSTLWAVAQLFLPREKNVRDRCLTLLREQFWRCDLCIADGRSVPVEPKMLDAHARETMPTMVQLLIVPRETGTDWSKIDDPEELERRLFLEQFNFEMICIHKK